MTEEERSKRDEELKLMARGALDVMAKRPEMRGAAILISCGIDMFFSFECNYVASTIMREKLCLCAWILGDSWHGLVPMMADTAAHEFPVDKIGRRSCMYTIRYPLYIHNVCVCLQAHLYLLLT
jgi:hypothetical protein